MMMTMTMRMARPQIGAIILPPVLVEEEVQLHHNGQAEEGREGEVGEVVGEVDQQTMT